MRKMNASGANATTHMSGEPKTALPVAVSMTPLRRAATACDGSLVVSAAKRPYATTPVRATPAAM